MLSRAQIILLKRGQAQAGIADAEYRDTLALLTGTADLQPPIHSSKDPRMTDEHLDKLLAYFEAVYWRGIDDGRLQPNCKPDAVFRKRGFWAAKNPKQNTSRDRFNSGSLHHHIAALESALHQLGFGVGYCAAIRAKVIGERDDAYALHLYLAALRRTVNARRKKTGNPQSPAPAQCHPAPVPNL